MILSIRIARFFGKKPIKIWSQANHIFKDYYSRRLTLSPNELQHFLLKLTNKKFSEQDHRWGSLIQNIENNLARYSQTSKIHMLKSLVGINSKSELIEKLMIDILSQVNSLNFEQASLALWCISKISMDQIENATKIYKRLCEIIKQYEANGNIVIAISKKIDQQLEDDKLYLKSATVCMVLTAMANLQILQKTILKYLMKSAVKPNISAFSTNGLVSLLIAVVKLRLQNKRDTLLIYKQIRQRHQQLQTGPMDTIINLSWTISNLSQSKYFEQKSQDQKPLEYIERFKKMHGEMKKFLLWLCQTIILRQEKKINKQMAAKILHYCGKAQAFDYELWSLSLKTICTNIDDCKIIDLVMALKAITSLQQKIRKQFSNHEEQISKRLWILYRSISGKSLKILFELYTQKKINPPPKFSEILNEYKQKQEKKQFFFKKRSESEKEQTIV